MKIKIKQKDLTIKVKNVNINIYNNSSKILINNNYQPINIYNLLINFKII